ncbi:hypothetical protein F751_6791 [Auxenochlorella protothecoides]|uniref:Uncharacterized protein n=1 Tax=Auxenochlorella protothecoides TaxID=3075 RepID=A0A087SDL9_AUXPR|nr:hypothetical protein F751_6791 [Auxenochlorella protothecoides]KFM23823.1 hypothetical protein F751_6791 [Auxenochlorella protothecoides]
MMRKNSSSFTSPSPSRSASSIISCNSSSAQKGGQSVWHGTGACHWSSHMHACQVQVQFCKG